MEIFNVDYCNHQLDLSKNKRQMKISIQATQVFMSIQSILKIDHVEEYIKNMKLMTPDDTHESTLFNFELNSFLDSDDASSIVQYAIRIKQLRTILESYENKFLDILNKIFLDGHLRPLTTLEMTSYVQLTKKTIKDFYDTRDKVCSSARNMFEVIVEQKKLTKLMAIIEKLESLEKKNFYA
jgi:hypothetical protein